MKSTYKYLILVCCFLSFGVIIVTQFWKMPQYIDQIINLKNEITQTNDNYCDAKYDIKFIVRTTQNSHEFLAHKCVLMEKSPYFEKLFGNSSISEIVYYDIDEIEFNLIMEILHHGNFRSLPNLMHLNNVIKFLSHYEILEKHTDAIDKTFADVFLNMSLTNQCPSIPLVANIYSIATEHNFNILKTNILKNIYTNWKPHNLFNRTDLVAYPDMFYDYIRYLNCVGKYSFA